MTEGEKQYDSSTSLLDRATREGKLGKGTVLKNYRKKDVSYLTGWFYDFCKNIFNIYILLYYIVEWLLKS